MKRKIEGKQSWSHIHNYLENYGLDTNVTDSFNEMLIMGNVFLNGFETSQEEAVF